VYFDTIIPLSATCAKARCEVTLDLAERAGRQVLARMDRNGRLALPAFESNM
jgi:hypothetical protein